MFGGCSGVTGAIDTLGAADGALASVVEALDFSCLGAPEVEEILARATCLTNRLGFLTCRAGARLSELKTYIGEGERSAANQLARRTGTSVGEARRRLQTGEVMDRLDKVAEAASTGEISPTQLEIICDAAQADPDSQQMLLDAAGSFSIAELRDEAARVKARVSDEDERRGEIHAKRYLRTFTDSDGGFNLKFRNNPEVGAEIMAAITPIADRFFEEARVEGRREATEAYRADALLAMARGLGSRAGGGIDDEEAEQSSTNGATSTPARSSTNGATSTPARSSTNAKIIVRIDLESLLRGYRVGEETCEIAGFGPIAVSTVNELMETGDPFLAAVVTRGKAVTGVAHLGRRPTAHQVTALQWLYPTCGVKGCSATTHLEIDHREEWAKTHFTLVDLCDRLCTHHHDLKSQEGWMLVEGTGKRDFVPPGDPRHPKHNPAQQTGPPKAA